MVLYLIVALKILMKVVWLVSDLNEIRMMVWIQRGNLEVNLILLLMRLHKMFLYLLPLQIMVLLKLNSNLNMVKRIHHLRCSNLNNWTPGSIEPRRVPTNEKPYKLQFGPWM